MCGLGSPAVSCPSQGHFVAATLKRALDHVRPILAEGYRGLGLERLVVGSARAVVDRLAAYRAMGFDYVVLHHISGDHSAILDSVELIRKRSSPSPPVGRRRPDAKLISF
jgi:alkanesulfonate monooxygenase SsuD/methylene tetrahydromethanopterin reductase-like flavin-dependent oxidoreductase (luciferase family)